MAMVSETDSFESIMAQLRRSTENLTIKRNLLVSQVDNLLILKERVTQNGHDKVMVLLGGDYFVEKTAKDAASYLERKLLSLKEAIDELNANIKHAEKTAEEFQKLQDAEKGQENSEDDGKYNEEGLPFIDIREEIDEDGNVISVNLNDDPVKVPPKNTNKSLMLEMPARTEPVKQSDNLDKNIDEPLLTPKNGASRDTSSEIGLSNTSPDTAIDTIQELFEDMEIVSRDVSGHSEKELKQGDLLNKIDQLKISENDKTSLLQIYEKLNTSQPQTSPSEKSKNNSRDIKEAVGANFINADGVTSTSTPKSANLAIDQNDLIELEILASEFEDMDGEAFDTSDLQDEEWYFDDDEDDDEDDDDDYADSLLYGSGKAALVPTSEEGQANEINDLLLRNIAQLRQNNTPNTTGKSGLDSGLSTESSSVLGSALKKDTKLKRKSVRFSENLEIKEITNVSEELKNITHVNQNMSRFMQNRMLNNPHSLRTDDERFTSSDQVSPMSELVVERDLDDSFEAPVGEVVSEVVSDIFEHDSDSFSLDEQTPEFSSFEGQSEIGVDVSNEDIFAEEDFMPDGESVEVMKENLNKAANKQKMSFFRQMRAQYPNLSQNGNKVEQRSGNKIQVRDVLGASNDEILDRRSLIAESIEKYEGTEASETQKEESPVMSDIVFKETSMISDANGSPPSSEDKAAPTKVSRFKSARQKAKVGASAVSEKPTKNGHNHLKDKEEHDRENESTDGEIAGSGSAVSQAASESRGNVETLNGTIGDQPDDMEVLGTTLDYMNLQGDMETMAKAYVLGMYDDDIATEGPVVNRLDDFEVLNRMVESMPSKEAVKKREEPETATDDFDPELDEIGDFDGPVLADEVIEHNYDDDLEWGEDTVQQDVIDLEVSASYYRMREKMIMSRNPNGFRKTEQEQEMEPVDEDGFPVQVSRFKAARLSMG